MTFPYQRLSASIAVAPQLGPEAMAEAAAAGFKSVINNRPDFEGGPDQPTSASVGAAALAAGLQYGAERAERRRHRPLCRARRDAAAADPGVLPHRHALGQARTRRRRGLSSRRSAAPRALAQTRSPA